MATYKLPEPPEVTVSVRGKDSLTSRQKALDKITQMVAAGELSADSTLNLSTEDLMLYEAPATNDDETQDPLELAVRELHQFLLLKIRTQKLKEVVEEIRAQIETILTVDEIEQDQEQLESSLKTSFKTIKEYVGMVKECQLAKPKASAALSLLDEALQFNLSIGADSHQANDFVETKVFASQPSGKYATTSSEVESINVATTNGYHT
jgi:hypothetical protein